MFKVVAAPTRGVQRVRPRMRNVGLVHVVAALVLAATLALGAMHGCAGDDVQVLPAAAVMTLLIGLAGLAMTLRLPRATAVAPALAAGASLTLLGGATSGWAWVLAQPCVGNILDREVVTLLLVTAASAAVLATSLWLLVSRDEIEPWHATRGVVVATAAAVTVLVLGTGFAVLLRDATGTPVLAMAAVTVPWAGAVAATGWLRPSPAIAVVTPAVLQALWLLLG
ncbi:MAG: hypothetical protein LH645_12370 [Actinomycetia bacterium]|nr:hypothetical protein [Actinomycetes bacterium]